MVTLNFVNLFSYVNCNIEVKLQPLTFKTPGLSLWKSIVEQIGII